jgi:molecular chaperone GrpE
MKDEKDKGADEVEFIPQPPEGGGGEAAAAPPAAAPEKREAEEKAQGEGARHLKDKLKKRDLEIRHLKKELDDLKEAHLRRLADMENLRKRFEREKADYQQYALNGLLLELVNIADNFERALQSASPPAEGEGKTLREGVELIFRMVQNLLAKHGVRPIVLESRVFDPNFHHAMTVGESDAVTEPTVEEELQKGYMIHDRLLRPTMVRVLVPKKGQ